MNFNCEDKMLFKDAHCIEIRITGVRDAAQEKGINKKSLLKSHGNFQREFFVKMRASLLQPSSLKYTFSRERRRKGGYSHFNEKFSFQRTPLYEVHAFLPDSCRIAFDIAFCHSRYPRGTSWTDGFQTNKDP